MGTKTSLNRLFLLLIILLGILSCSQSYEKQKTVDFEKQYWHRDSIVSLQFIPEANQKYNLSFLIRNDNEYPYSNLFLIGSISDGKNKIVDTLEYDMADAEGNWLGTGVGEIKESKLVFKKNYLFKDTIPYIISVQHAVRKTGNIKGDKIAKGITNVGIIIEKSE